MKAKDFAELFSSLLNTCSLSTDHLIMCNIVLPCAIQSHPFVLIYRPALADFTVDLLLCFTALL